MVFIPPGTSLDIFDDMPWNAMIGGVPLGNAPHTVPKGECELVCDYKSEDGHNIQYTKGIRGQVIERKGPEDFCDDGSVKIFIKGVTDQGGSCDKWVPRGYVTIGIGKTARKTTSKNEGKAA